jgi:hypothetical protein
LSTTVIGGTQRNEADLLGLRCIGCGNAVQVLAHADVAEIGARVHRVLVFLPQPAAVAKLDVLIFGGHLQHIRVEIAEAGGEQQGRPVQFDHALHRFRNVVGLGNLFFLDDLHAGRLLQHRGGFGVCLIVSIIVFRPDIDEANN